MRLSNRAQIVQLVLGYIGHNLALLALAGRAGGARAGLARAGGGGRRRCSRALVARRQSGRQRSQALNVWIIQIVVAIGPPLGALIFMIYMKTDWGISLFFLVPLALVAIPALRLQRIALFNITAIWLVITLATLAASPYIAAREMAANPQRAPRPMARAPNSPAN